MAGGAPTVEAAGVGVVCVEVGAGMMGWFGWDMTFLLIADSVA
jgi:hypothetical protein